MTRDSQGDFDIKSFLATTELFKELPDAQLTKVAEISKLQPRVEKADQPIVVQEEKAPGIFIVISGVVRLIRRPLPELIEGVWKQRDVLPGELFGEVEFVHEEDEAITSAMPQQLPVLLLLLEREALWELINTDPLIAIGIMRRLARRYKTRVTALTEFRMLRPEQRFRLYMYRHAVDKDIELTTRELAEIVNADERNILAYIKKLSTASEPENYCIKKTHEAMGNSKRERRILRVHKPEKLLSILKRDW